MKKKVQAVKKKQRNKGDKIMKKFVEKKDKNQGKHARKFKIGGEIEEKRETK